MVKRTSRVAGWAVAAAFGVVGLVAGPAVVVLAVVAAVLGAGTGFAVAARAGAPRTPAAVRFSAGGIGGVLVVAGLVVVVGPLAVPVAALVLAVVVWRRRNVLVAPESSVTDLRRLSNAELGREWQRSHLWLCAARGADELDRVTTLRRHQLDEIERRNPVGCREWLAGGAWAAGDPVPFLGI